MLRPASKLGTQCRASDSRRTGYRDGRPRSSSHPVFVCRAAADIAYTRILARCRKSSRFRVGRPAGRLPSVRQYGSSRRLGAQPVDCCRTASHSTRRSLARLQAAGCLISSTSSRPHISFYIYIEMFWAHTAESRRKVRDDAFESNSLLLLEGLRDGDESERRADGVEKKRREKKQKKSERKGALVPSHPIPSHLISSHLISSQLISSPIPTPFSQLVTVRVQVSIYGRLYASREERVREREASELRGLAWTKYKRTSFAAAIEALYNYDGRVAVRYVR
ncbi:hypothetical protein V9T40_000193 [Parthenolecanium corni]|uniref:Uncharacterized protein n=1 Tax=Parthenolecanium corni TaxID=536013 RepID=A0AAN9TCG6_9HEMI